MDINNTSGDIERGSLPVLPSADTQNGNNRNVMSLQDSDNNDKVSTQSSTGTNLQNQEGESLQSPQRQGQAQSWMKKVDPRAFHFAIRMSTCLAAASLFALVPTPDSGRGVVPQGVWVIITVVVVSWFPSLDAASVLHRTSQRVLGTAVGAMLGLGLGFLSTLTRSYVQQALFLLGAVVFVTFVWCLGTVQYLTKTLHYAATLGLVTFCLALFPFYSARPEEDFKIGVYRIMNVLIGCVIGSVGSLLIWPVSTQELLLQGVKRQYELAGDAAEAVLTTAAKTFSGQVKPIPLAAVLTESRNRFKVLQGHDYSSGELEEDAVHVAYAKAIHGWSSTRALFPLFDYDPFHLYFRYKQTRKAKKNGENVNRLYFREVASVFLARAFRLQSTVILMDSIVRNDRGHNFTNEQLRCFEETGHLVKKMLILPRSDECSDRAMELLDRIMLFRRYAGERMTDDDHELTTPPDSIETWKQGLSSNGRRMHSSSTTTTTAGLQTFMPIIGNDDSSLLFLQLVEHLVLRSLRLYVSWEEVETFSFLK